MTAFILLWAVTLVLAFAAGMAFADKTTRAHWWRYGYCPACDRLGCERELT